MHSFVHSTQLNWNDVILLLMLLLVLLLLLLLLLFFFRLLVLQDTDTITAAATVVTMCTCMHECTSSDVAIWFGSLVFGEWATLLVLYFKQKIINFSYTTCCLGSSEITKHPHPLRLFPVTVTESVYYDSNVLTCTKQTNNLTLVHFEVYQEQTGVGMYNLFYFPPRVRWEMVAVSFQSCCN